MENRFGFKDLCLIVLVLLLGGLVLLAMKQYDRQWAVLQDLSHKLDEQSRDLASVRRQLDRGAAVTTAGPAVAGVPADDPSARVRAATTMPGFAAHDWYVATGTNTDKLTPLVSTDSFAAAVQQRVFETLVQRDPESLEWVPLLALPGWTVEDHIADYHRFVDPKLAAGAKEDEVSKDPACPCPIRVTFHIRPGVTFSDGAPLTADDVKWTFDWTLNPAVEAPRARSALDKVRRVVRTGADGVTFELAQPYFDPVELTGTNAILPRHYYEPIGTEAFNRSSGLLLGSGRYKFEVDPKQKQWTPGNTVELVRNDRYWGEPASIDRLVYKIIVSDLPRLTAFTNGELDAFGANPVQYRGLLANPEVMARCTHMEYETPNTGYRFIAWNQERNGKPTQFADRRVRQAMTLLCDRQRVCDDVMLGQATVATGPFNRLGKQNDPSIKPWPFDVEGAKALLREAGYTDDGSGTLKGPDGQPFVVKVTYPLGSTVYDRVMLQFKDSFAKAGVTFVPDRLDWSAFNQHLKDRDFEAVSMGWTAGLENDIYQMFDSSQIADGGDNFMSYRNPEFDAAVRQARQTLDPAVRLPLWRRCHAILHEDQPYTFLFTAKTLTLIDKRFRNVQRVPIGLNDISEWYVPVGQAKWVK
jgi:peptide/nickel transport system substrate-binding protein